MEITNRVFTAALLNPTSEEYQTLYKEVCDLVRLITIHDDKFTLVPPGQVLQPETRCHSTMENVHTVVFYSLIQVFLVG